MTGFLLGIWITLLVIVLIAEALNALDERETRKRYP